MTTEMVFTLLFSVAAICVLAMVAALRVGPIIEKQTDISNVDRYARKGA